MPIFFFSKSTHRHKGSTQIGLEFFGVECELRSSKELRGTILELY
jgi:hypothetical protein